MEDDEQPPRPDIETPGPPVPPDEIPPQAGVVMPDGSVVPESQVGDEGG